MLPPLPATPTGTTPGTPHTTLHVTLIIFVLAADIAVFPVKRLLTNGSLLCTVSSPWVFTVMMDVTPFVMLCVSGGGGGDRSAAVPSRSVDPGR